MTLQPLQKNIVLLANLATELLIAYDELRYAEGQVAQGFLGNAAAQRVKVQSTTDAIKVLAGKL